QRATARCSVRNCRPARTDRLQHVQPGVPQWLSSARHHLSLKLATVDYRSSQSCLASEFIMLPSQSRSSPRCVPAPSTADTYPENPPRSLRKERPRTLPVAAHIPCADARPDRTHGTANPPAHQTPTASLQTAGTNSN